MSPSDIVQKLWNYCNVLRDDGMSYGDYVEQLTYLLFLKMADERTRQLLLRCSTFRHPWRSQAPYNQKSPVPEKYSWPSLAPTLTLPRKRGRGLSCGDELFDF